MGRCVLVAMFFKVLIHLSLQSTDDGIPANLTILIPDVELSEREDSRVMLGGGPVLTCQDDDGDPVGAYIQDISPTAGCGMSCLQLEPCGGDGNFCLWFLANSVLYFSTVSFYTLTIGCTDDVEAVVSQDMSVTIVSNIPPTFDPNNPAYASVNVHGQKTTHDARYKLYKVKTDDTEDDPVFYTMSTNPITDLIEIEYATGQVRAARDLRLLCETLVSGSVWARDPYSSVVGPFTLDINVDNYNERPTITNLDTTVTINENERVDKRVLDFVVVDGKLNDHNYNQRSATSAGMEAYRLRGSSLRARISLDYEREDTRSVKLYFDVDDGFCSSETYSLTVNVLDVPEEPEYTSTEMLIMTDEGHINEPNNVFILDEDLNEVHTHAKETGSSDLFEVEPTTGNIISIDYLQLVPGRMYKDYTVRMRATDKDGLTTSRYEAKVRVFDINDRRPYFTNFNQPFRVSAHECMDPGSILGRVKGTDDDSEYNQNNWVYFGGGGGNFDIAANGWIVLNQRCLNGETYTGTATISDQGLKPGPLTGDPMGVIVNCGPCPTESDTATTAATTSAPTTNTTAGASSGSEGGGRSSTDDLLTWAVPALVGAVTWLALTICLAYRLCCPCRNPCSGYCRNRPPTPIRVTPEPPQEKPGPPPKPLPPPPKPKTPPTHPPVPLPPPVTVPDPYMFGFWKETFTDQDQKTKAKRSKPVAIENMPAGEGNALPPEHLRLGPPGADGSLPRFLPGNSPRAVSPAQIGPITVTQPERKSKLCAIL